MNETKNVVVAYDFSEHGRAVLERAIALASRAPFHALHFVTVLDPRKGVEALPPDGHVDFEYADRAREFMTARINEAFQAANASDEVQFFMHVRIGAACDEILGVAKEIGADLIFIGTHGYTGFKHLVMGSVAERVVREAGCPVMVVRPKTYPNVELDKIFEVPAHGRPESRLYRFSYTNKSVVMKPLRSF